MKASRHQETIHLTFRPLECKILHPILASIRQNYKKSPSAFSELERNAWYSTRGCETAGLDEQDTREWTRSLHQNRLSHLSLLQTWLSILDPSAAGEKSVTLDLTLEQAPTFVSILNDHRLLMHAQNDLGEEDLVYPPLDNPPSPPPPNALPARKSTCSRTSWKLF